MESQRERGELVDAIGADWLRRWHLVERPPESSRHHQSTSLVHAYRDRRCDRKRGVRLVRARRVRSDPFEIPDRNVFGRSLSAGDENSCDMVSTRPWSCAWNSYRCVDAW